MIEIQSNSITIKGLPFSLVPTVSHRESHGNRTLSFPHCPPVKVPEAQAHYGLLLHIPSVPILAALAASLCPGVAHPALHHYPLDI